MLDKPMRSICRLLTSSSKNRNYSLRQDRKLGIEQCEERCLLAIAVDTVIDNIDFSDNVTTLREAIQLANNAPGPDTITFSTLPAGSTVSLTQGSLNITEPVTIDGTTLGGGEVTITRAVTETDNDLLGGIRYTGDGSGGRLEVRDVVFEDFSVGSPIQVATLGNNDRITINSNRFTGNGIGIANSNFDTAAIEILDNVKGTGVILIEGNEIYNNDIGVKYDNVAGSSASVPNFSRIGGNQFKDPAGTMGNVLESIVLGRHARNINIEDNDFYLNDSSEVAIEIDGLTQNGGNTSGGQIYLMALAA